MEYPGRVIIIGQGSNGNTMALYAITGRSPSSQARRLTVDPKKCVIDVIPTDEETLKTGQVDLLVYSAFMYSKGLIVGNGKQTSGISAAMNTGVPAVEVLAQGQREWEYEPDQPNCTPRISGCITTNAAFSIIKCGADGKSIRQYFEIPMMTGVGHLISTYTGENAKPLPTFKGEPIQVGLPFTSAQECVDALYAALAPAAGKPDYRVTAAAAVIAKDGVVSVAVKNRADL
jgi:IMP cyclohydrolase